MPMLARNAFRIAGVSAAAGRAELLSAARSLEHALKLGVSPSTPWDCPWLGPLERSDGGLQEAMGRLTNIGLRLTQRLFWFGPGAEALGMPAGVAPPPVAPDAVSPHDQALYLLARATVVSPRLEDFKPWREAVSAWKGVIADQNYWNELVEQDRAGGYEPVAGEGDVEDVRKQALRLAILPVVKAAQAALARSDPAFARRTLGLVRSLSLEPDLLFDLETELLGPLEAGVTNLAGQIQAECQVQRDNVEATVQANRSICEKATARLTGELLPRLATLSDLASGQAVFTLRARSAVVDTMLVIASAWTWAQDWIRSEALLEQAEAFAEDTPIAGRVTEKLKSMRSEAQVQRDGWKPVKKAPTLHTVNGIGTTLYTFNRKHPFLADLYYGTLYFVAIGIPLLPLARYVVGRGPVKGKSWYFRGRVRFGTGERIHLAVLVLLVFLFFLRLSTKSG